MTTPSSHDTALEHLRIIRTLMERAHIYRAVSAPAAFIGGLLALTAAAWGLWQDYDREAGSGSGDGFTGTEFLVIWLTLLVVASVINLGLLMRESHSKGQPMVTDGLKMALRAVVPPLLCGGVLGICLVVYVQQMELAALVWMLGYGLSLQATVSFAPRSIILLARAFLMSGLALTVIWFSLGGPGLSIWNGAVASAFLGLTFGLFHIVYAAAVFLSKPVPEPALSATGD
jgi:hypothetical protein